MRTYDDILSLFYEIQQKDSKEDAKEWLYNKYNLSEERLLELRYSELRDSIYG